MNEIKFILSCQGKLMLAYEGNLYYMNGEAVDGSTRNYDCSKKCGAKIKLQEYNGTWKVMDSRNGKYFQLLKH